MNRPPYIVMGMPRSRTAWLAAFLSSPGFPGCEHEPSRLWSGRSDLWRFLDREDGTGISDATLTWFWRDILAFRPDARIVVTWRDAEAVRTSCRRAGIPLTTPDGLDELSAEALTAVWHQGGILSVAFEEMEHPRVLHKLFEHCHQRGVPEGWMVQMRGLNIQAPWRERFAEGFANAAGFARFMAERGQPVPRRGEAPAI